MSEQKNSGAVGLAERLRVNSCQYSHETPDQASRRRIETEFEAADEIDRLIAQLVLARKALDEIAPAVENLACHQEQCDMDGVMVKVSRQALDEVLNGINAIAVGPLALSQISQGAEE